MFLLCACLICFSFIPHSRERFDNVILCSSILTYCKQTGRRDVSLHRQGSQIRHMIIGGIRLGEIKRLLAPGTSLSSLGVSCGIPEVKSIFPFSRLTTFQFLQEKQLPTDCADWASDLTPDKIPTQAEVDAALALFREKNMKTVSDFLEYYLTLDCVILQLSIIKMHDIYFQFLGLSFVDCRRHTVSSFSSVAAHHYLARFKHGAAFFVNHQRIYSLLKQSLRGGLTFVGRTVCGKHANMDGYVDLLKKQMETGGADGGPDLDLCDRVEASGLGVHGYATHINPHLVPRGESFPANSALYLDLNS
jgi:hypothetical protein